MMRFHRLPAKGKPPRHTNAMNGTEKAYDTHLTELVNTKAIERYWFHAVNLRLADKCFYQTDFLVQMPDGELVIHEVKGFMQDTALVKLKVVAESFPFRVIVCKKIARKNGGGWDLSEIGKTVEA